MCFTIWNMWLRSWQLLRRWLLHRRSLDLCLELVTEFFVFESCANFDEISAIGRCNITFGCRCNKLDKKDYYPIFKLTGFTGFDGSFKNWKIILSSLSLKQLKSDIWSKRWNSHLVNWMWDMGTQRGCLKSLFPWYFHPAGIGSC